MLQSAPAPMWKIIQGPFDLFAAHITQSLNFLSFCLAKIASKWFFSVFMQGLPLSEGSLPHCSFFLRNCMMTHGKQARALFVAVVPRGFNLNAPSPLQACRVEGLFGHLRFCSRLLHKLFAFRLGLLEDACGPVRNSLAQALLILRRPVKKSKGVATMRHRPDSLRSMH